MKNFRVESVVVTAGLIIVGFCIYSGLQSFAERDRSVAVRGFSERIIEADKVTWPLHFKMFGDNLSTLYDEANTAKAKVTRFLTKNGVSPMDISYAAPEVTDYTTLEYKPEAVHDRYAIDMKITVSSKNVKLIRSLTYRTPELMKQGVPLKVGDYSDPGISYDYDGLEKLKPTMIEASTKNAREAAEKFAKDSGSKLGKIKNATQGYFSIDDRDVNTPWLKKVRVVTSVEYYLKN